MAFGKRTDGSESPIPRPVDPNLTEIGSPGERPERGQRILDFLMKHYRDPHGISAETILSAVGALAGFAAQEAIWEGMVRTGKMSAAQALVSVKTKTGETYYFGDFLNMVLASTKEGQLSIWRLVGSAAAKAGAKSLPKLEPAFARCAQTVGTAEFGKPQLPANLLLKELPRESLQHWPAIKAILLAEKVQPLFWPFEIAAAAQKLIVQAKDAIPADIGAWIVMQSAIAMSKIDPKTIPGGTTVEQ